MSMIRFDRLLRFILIVCFSTISVLYPHVARADAKTETDKIVTVLDRECINLKKDN